MGKDLITILLPVHNDERYLGHCLESLKIQSHSEFKCLVGFNGTKDRSKDIFKDLVGKDSRFSDLDYGTESGKSITLNKMLREVQTEITCLIDGDDMWHPDKLRRQVKRLGEATVECASQRTQWPAGRRRGLRLAVQRARVSAVERMPIAWAESYELLLVSDFLETLTRPSATLSQDTGN